MGAVIFFGSICSSFKKTREGDNEALRLESHLPFTDREILKGWLDGFCAVQGGLW